MGLVVIIVFVGILAYMGREETRTTQGNGIRTRSTARNAAVTRNGLSAKQGRYITHTCLKAKNIDVAGEQILCALQESGHGLEAYIHEPPKWALQDPLHGGCFTARGKGWYALHQESFVHDPDIAFDGFESVLHEMYWRAKRRSA